MPTSAPPSSPVIPSTPDMQRKGRFGKGYVVDQRDKTKDKSIRGLFGAPVRVAAEASLEQYVTTIYNQLDTESCVGWATAQWIKFRLAIQGTPIPLPSAEGIYVGARALARKNAGLAPAQAPLLDTGSQPSLALQALSTYGVPSAESWPFDPATINDEPNLEELEIASAFLLTGYYVIGTTGSQRVADVRQAIANGFPVMLATQVDQAFEDYAGGPTPLTAPNPKTLVGGHMINLVGYTSDGRVRGVNQWGVGWGDRGLFWADLAWLQSDYATDIFVLEGHATGHAGTMSPKPVDATA